VFNNIAVSDLLHDGLVLAKYSVHDLMYITLHCSLSITVGTLQNRNCHSQTTKSKQSTKPINDIFLESASPLPLLFESQTTRKNTNFTPKKPEHEQKGALDIQLEYILLRCLCTKYELPPSPPNEIIQINPNPTLNIGQKLF
jgi:hypothetical protein